MNNESHWYPTFTDHDRFACVWDLQPTPAQHLYTFITVVILVRCSSHLTCQHMHTYICTHTHTNVHSHIRIHTHTNNKISLSFYQVFRGISKIIQQCWLQSSEARLTALRVKKSLANLQSSIMEKTKKEEHS